MKNNIHNEVFITESAEETQKKGEAFAKKIKKGSTVFLFGDLGSGKTTFMQGFARGLGIKTRIISPTFIIMRHYEIKNQKSKIKSSNQNAKFFYHIDLYRIQSKNDIENLGIDEAINNPENIVAIEWAEKIGAILPKERVEIYFEYIDEKKRKITIKNYKHQITNKSQ